VRRAARPGAGGVDNGGNGRKFWEGLCGVAGGEEVGGTCRNPGFVVEKTMTKSVSVLGRKAIAAISAVEGLALSDAAQKRQAEADRLGLTSVQRQAVIAKAYLASAK
jgi:hypothetical protein